MPQDEPFEDKELRDWLDALALGELTPDAAEALKERLRSDPVARIAYLKSISFDALLHREFPRMAGMAEATEAESDLLPEEESHVAEPVMAVKPARSRWADSTWPRWAAAAALVILSGAIALSLLGSQHSIVHLAKWMRKADQTSVPRLSVATITNLRDAVPANGRPPFAIGQRAVRGSLALASGTVELTFDCGAVVVLEGPANIVLENEYRARLASGRLRADVPHQAIGFLIDTPRGVVRDLGTEFGVRVQQNGKTELHVLQGKVEAQPGGEGAKSAPSLVVASEAVRLTSAAKTEPVAFDPAQFDADLPPAQPSRHSPDIHWSFDTAGSSTLVSEGEPHHLTLKRGAKMDPTPDARVVPGVFGAALRFNGSDESAVSDYSGIAGFAPRTVAAWVKIPKDSRVNQPNGIIAWGRFAAGEKWQLATNILRTDGTVGALRQEFGFGYIIGSTDLRDGAWHHIAVVFHGGPNTDVTTDVKLYVDGRLEVLSGQHRQTIDTATKKHVAADYKRSPVFPVMFGKYLPQAAELIDQVPPWRGELDEVHIFNDAISPAEVVTLMSRNTLQ